MLFYSWNEGENHAWLKYVEKFAKSVFFESQKRKSGSRFNRRQISKFKATWNQVKESLYQLKHRYWHICRGNIFEHEWPKIPYHALSQQLHFMFVCGFFEGTMCEMRRHCGSTTCQNMGSKKGTVGMELHEIEINLLWVPDVNEQIRMMESAPGAEPGIPQREAVVNLWGILIYPLRVRRSFGCASWYLVPTEGLDFTSPSAPASVYYTDHTLQRVRAHNKNDSWKLENEDV